MIRIALLLCLFGAASSMVSATSVPLEYIVISDINVDPTEALSGAMNKAGTTALRGAKARAPKVKQQVRVKDEDSSKNSRERIFTLVSELSESELGALLTTPGVQRVVPNVPIELAAVDVTPALDIPHDLLQRQLDAIGVAEATSQWNLDRVDQSFGRDNVYNPAPELGSNVDLYVIDTGVQGNHVAFGNRVQPGKDGFVSEDLPGNTDCHSHGTHVASTAAGNFYGVARAATIFPVRILECDGRGSLMSMSNGISWARSMIQKRGSSRKAVVNLSIQAGASDVIDELVRSLHQVGAVVVVAAANFNSDACNYSPAREPVAVTVGASSDDDSKLSSSNFGPCVDLFAPGDNIVGASPWAASDGSVAGTSTKRGTSMASPLVAGIAATIFERYPRFTNVQVIAHLLSIATRLGRRVSDVDCSGSLEGVRFAQALSAGPRGVSLNRPSMLVQGSVVSGEFQQWAPELSPSAGSGASEICVTFNARVTSARVMQSVASVRVAVATTPLLDGITSFTESPMQCKDSTARWYVMDSYAAGTSRSFSSKIWDFQGNIIGDQPRAPSGELSSSEARPFYLSLKTSEDGLSIELGSGDGSSERDRNPLVNALDANFNVGLGSLARLSFSSSSSFDILYTDIRPCAGSAGGDDDPTDSPSWPPVGNGGDVPPANLAITRPMRNIFQLWPQGWSKPDSETTSCFQFDVKLNRAAKIFMALATAPMGKVRFNAQLQGTRSHVLAFTRNTLQLFRDGAVVDQKYISPVLPVPKRGTLNLTLRLTETAEGIVQLQILLASQWRDLYMFADSGAGFQGTRFSVTSSVARAFTNIQVCEA